MRKNTYLEGKLIRLGFWLDSKNYTGKKSEKTLSYIYRGVLSAENELFGVVIEIDAKREKIIAWGIPNIECDFFTSCSLADCYNKMSVLENALKNAEVI